MATTKTLRDLDPALVELADALADAVDTGRAVEIDRLRLALEPFGAAELFADELRLCGRSSLDDLDDLDELPWDPFHDVSRFPEDWS